MRLSTILFGLAAAMLAVNGLSTALVSDGSDKDTEEKLQLLRSGSVEHENEEERLGFRLFPRFRTSSAEKAKALILKEVDKSLDRTAAFALSRNINSRNRHEAFRWIEKNDMDLEGAFKFMQDNGVKLTDQTKEFIRKDWRGTT